MTSTVTYEVNSKRKSQRIEIPIFLGINKKLYKVKDWSLTGIAISTDEELQLENEEILKAVIVLPLKGAKLELDTEIQLKNHRQNIYGFEYINMTQNNKNVLRHFIQLAIEGKADSVEDLLSNYSMPNIETPIKEPIALTQEEKNQLKSSFRKNLFKYLLFATLLLFLIITTFLYNMAIAYQEKGVVFGNYDKYVASINGIINIMNVKENERVLKGEILYQIEPKNSSLIKENGEKDEIKFLMKRLKTLQKELKSLKNSNTHILTSINKTLPEADRIYQKRLKEYLEAKRVFDAKMMVKSQFDKIEEKYLSAKNRLEVLKAQKRVLKSEISNKLEQKREKLKLSIAEIKQKIKDKSLKSINIDTPPVIARNDGIVNYIKHREGEYVHYADLVMIVETKTKPFILLKIPFKDSIKIHKNLECLITSYYTKERYRGVITKIDYTPRDNISFLTKEMSKDDTIIRIDFIDDNVRLALNSRVNIWIIKRNLIGEFFKRNILFSTNPYLTKVGNFLLW